MTASISLRLDRLPNMAGLLGRSALCRKPRDNDPRFPAIEARAASIRADPRKVQQYREVCRFAANAETLPPTYPHILAFRLHLEMLLHRSFPVAPMGLIHLRNEIVQHRPIALDDAMDFHCYLAGHRDVDKGVEFGIRSDVAVEGEKVWEDLSVIMVRLPQRDADSRRREPPPMPEYPHSETWELPADLGRRYARASGDYNPIHLYAATARLLGFRRQIVHGMWSKARCVAALQPLLGSERCRVGVEFKTPVYLPGTVKLVYGKQEGEVEFELRDGAETRPHLRGEMAAW